LATPLTLTRDQILAYRRRVQSLDERLPLTDGSLRQAAWAGLQDSMPRAALLSIHARVAGTQPTALDHPALVQVWGPRYSTYVVPAQDVAVFTLGRIGTDAKARVVPDDLAARLESALAGRRMTDGEAADAIGARPTNRLRYASLTGRVLIRWDGASAPIIWTIPPPEMDAGEARLELARRFLHVFGPATQTAFSKWACIGPADGAATFAALGDGLTPVHTPVGDAWILAAREGVIRAPARPAAPARLLPSGDTYWLYWGADRELLVPDAAQRDRLWTPRVWPGAVLVNGETVGTWRRAGAKVTIQPWRRLSLDEQEAVEQEAASLPLPNLRAPITATWAADGA
jgi:hypothetical protein